MFSGGDDKSRFLRKDGKKALGLEDGRKRREDKNISLRTARRDELLAKKRREPGTEIDASHAAGLTTYNPVTGLPMTQPLEVAEPIPSIPELTQLIQSENPVDQFRGTSGFRRLLAQDHDPPIEEVVSIGDCVVVRRLVQFLKRDENPKLQFEAAWALTNIASGTTENTRLLIDHKAIGEFLRLVSSPDADVQEQAVWALGNVAGDSHKFRDYLHSIGGLTPLLDLARSNPPDSLIRLVSWAISNLCRGKPAPRLADVQPALPVLARLLHHHDQAVVVDVCWAFSYITESNQDRIEAVMALNITPRLIEILSSPYTQTTAGVKLATPAVRIIGNFVTGDDMQTERVIANGALAPLRALLKHPQPAMRKEACWTLSNITAGTPQQVQAVIDADIFPPLLENLRSNELHVKKEAAWAVSNATTSENPAHIEYLVRQNVIPILIELLDSNLVKLLCVALEGLSNILAAGHSDTQYNPYAVAFQQCGGIQRLEMLESHRKAEVYEKAAFILNHYFEAPEEGEGDHARDMDVIEDVNLGQDPGATGMTMGAPISFM